MTKSYEECMDELARQYQFPDWPQMEDYLNEELMFDTVKDRMKEAALLYGDSIKADAYSIDKETIERLEKEKKRLEDWKDEMITLTTPLLDWGQSKESGIRPGHSIFEEALKRSKEYPKLQELEKEKEQLHEIIELNRDTILNWQEVDVMNKRLISDLRKELKEYRGRVW